METIDKKDFFSQQTQSTMKCLEMDLQVVYKESVPVLLYPNQPQTL